jgi:hypothetical protein
MNSSTTTPAPPRSAAEVNKVLTKLADVNAQQAPPTATESAAQPARRSRRGDSIRREFEVEVGEGITVTSTRFPKSLHARVLLKATANKIARRSPASVQDIVLQAVQQWMDVNDAA